MSKIEEFFDGKVDIFSRGTFQMFTFLILFSIAFIHMYKEKVVLFIFCTLIILLNELIS